ncbi:transposase [Streptomyces dysideae]|uniref:Transposase n=1 Tax=Streptomyces dysideae TaxID=909626 RepID=A0A124IFH1_9ACTN|nr:transposase [Streptomyces dysideae]KUO21456.1 transposase [Streptomyces dysideae]
MSRKLPLGEGETVRTACARGLLRAGVVEKTGEVLSAAVLAQRVGWAADLVCGMAAGLLAGHGNAADVDVLASGEDAGGRKLPSQAWMALRRLGWTAAPAGGVKVNDRIVRMAQEQAGRALRSAHWRAGLTSAVLQTWPCDPGRRTPTEWDQVREAVPGGRYLPSSVIRSRTRQITTFATKHGRLPTDVSELEAPPGAARMLLLLSACDGQQATIERSEDDPQRAPLPTRPDPRSYRDWTWVACPLTLPPTVPPGAVLHLPTLRITGNKVRADLAYTHAVPRTSRTGHTVALGVDWGLNTLLSAGAARLHDDGWITALGHGAQFRAAGVLARQHRLRRLSEHLHTKADQYQRLIDADEQHELSGKHDVLRDEIRFVSDRRANLNDALARAAARWTVDQAITAHATVIYLEDLRSMEAKGMGRTTNTRMSQTVRGQIADRIRHLAAEAGIAVVTVPPRNTSKHCPNQAVITPTADTRRADQSKGPTRRRSTRPAPRRRRAPSPTGPQGTAGQRPEGHAPTGRRTLPRAAHRHQSVTTISTPSPRLRPGGPPSSRHRPRGTARGAGFHLHAHATPPRWAEPTPDATSDMGSPN